MTQKHVCPLCDHEFDAKHNDRICGTCKQEITHRLLTKKVTPGVCPVCGETFKIRAHKMFCSKECRITALSLPGMKDVILNKYSDLRPTADVKNPNKNRSYPQNRKAPTRPKKPKINEELDRVAAEAIKQGISYGRYIARKHGNY